MTEFIIHDTTPSDVTHHPDLCRGLDLSPRPFAGYAYGAVADPFDDQWLIPRHEWQARIQEMEQQQSRISDLIRLKKLPPKNQQRTNYCWIFAPTHAVEILRLQQNQKVVSLSPASAGAKIKGYRNVGGWGKEGLEFIVKHGLCPSSVWPDTTIDNDLDTEQARELAKRYRVTEWVELEPRNLDQLVSMLLHRVPVACGFNWWGHEVLATDAVWVDGAIAIRIRNSWGYWGDGNGFGVLQGKKMLPDDAVAPRVAIAS